VYTYRITAGLQACACTPFRIFDHRETGIG
jgi:hypothetical protein